MDKKIKTTNTDIAIETTRVDVVQIGTFSFERDERFPWINVYQIGNESKEFIEEIDDEEIVTTFEELKIAALNWVFNNVEIVKEINN